MQWSEINWKPSSKSLRQFAAIWLIFLGVLATWQGLLQGNVLLALFLGFLALAIGSWGLIHPLGIRPIYVGLMILAFPIGWTVSKTLLVFMFYGMFTPLGLVFRLIGRDALALKFRPDKTTYWTPKPGAGDVRRYFRQF